MAKDSFNVRAIDKLLKRLILISYYVLMLSSVAGVQSTVKKCAIIGQGAQLFSIDNDYPDPSLYNKTDTRIASWKGTTYTVADMDHHYSGKIFMDRKRNIWIFDVGRRDAGKYYLKFGIQIVRHEILLIIMEKLTELPQECTNDPDFTKEGNLTGEQIGHEVRKWLADHPEYIKEYLDGWHPLQIVTCIIVTILLLMQLANRNQIREGLINMKDWLQKKFCSQNMSENASENKETVIDIEEPGNFTGEQIREIRKLLDDHTKHIKEYLGNFTGEQIREIRKLLDDHTKHIKEYLDEIKAKIPKLSKEIEALLPAWNGRDIENEDEFHTLLPGRKKIQIRETERNMKSRDSESNDERNELLPEEHVDQNN